MSEMTGLEFIRRFEEFAPQTLSEKGDPIGLAIGTLNKPIKRILVTLDVRPEVVEEAIKEKVDLIFAHHPPIFRPISAIHTDDPQMKMYADLIKQDIAVYAAHTNLDAAENGLNDWLAQKLGLTDTNILTVTHTDPYKKLAVYVPEDDEAKVTRALHDAGAGEIGDYKDVSYVTEGKGRFTPQEGSTPTIGSIGKAEVVQESRIEVLVPDSKVSAVLSAMKQAHPYEEPVYDLFSLDGLGKEYGFGRIGFLKNPMSLKEYVREVAHIFEVEGLRYIGQDLDKPIHKVAVLGGDGGKFYTDAVQQDADVFITGDVYYHTGHDMLADGLNVIDPGHHIESICKPYLTDLFQSFAKESDWDVDIIPSKLNTDPFHFYPAIKK